MLRHICRALALDERGQISIVFAFTSLVLVLAVGAGVDLSRSYLALQKLTHSATLTCQYASRATVVATASNIGTYTTKVEDYLDKTLVEQNFEFQQTNGTPFTHVANGTADVSLSADVDTTFMQIFGIDALPVNVAAHCFDSPATINQTIANPSGLFAVNETFEANGGSTSYRFFPPTGSGYSAPSTPQSTFPSVANYTGAAGSKWHIMGYCLETDAAGVIRAMVPEGGRSAELDCDNGSGNKGNSSISTKVYLTAGNYELRYNYTIRTYYPEYTYSVLCGSTAADISWATNSTVGSGGGSGQKTNQINVYLDQNTSSNAPLLHTTISGETLAGNKLIDNCLYSDDSTETEDWIERSVRIYISSPGDYWLTFAADGNNDSFGGQIDAIRLCRISCSDTLDDSFVSAWLTNPALFQDTFESPTYTVSSGNVNNQGNLYNSHGTSSATTSGWPDETVKGWSVAPFNQMDIVRSTTLSAQGTYSLELDGSTNTPLNRSISRTFLLVPGYYKVEYRYISNAVFNSASFVSPSCGATPTAAGLSTFNSGSSAAQTPRIVSTMTGNRPRNTNYVGVMMSHTQLMSRMVGSSSLAGTPTYLNPTGTTTTTPTNAPDAVDVVSYNASQNNPLLDICGFARTWQSRTAYVKILKPNYYQLNIAALGTSDGIGGSIDDVKVSAVGGMYMSSPPSGAVTIPVPGTQPDTVVTNTGYLFVANPLQPPAALQ